MTPFDVCVAGLGAAGSATAFHLASRGERVLGLDRWRPRHPFGSSHGDSRIIREIYFEHPMYVPIVRRAYDLWRDLEARTGKTLLSEVGGLMIGPPDGEVVTGTILISSPCSGHGFKFASAIGEVHADLLTTGRCRFDLSAFRLRSAPGAVARARGRT